MKSKKPTQGRPFTSSLDADSETSKANDSCRAYDKSMDSPLLAVYFVEHVGLFEQRSLELIGTYGKARDAVTSFYNTVREVHWRYEPVPIADHLYRVVNILREQVGNIRDGGLQSFEYLLPTPFRDEDAAIIGVTRLPIKHHGESNSVLTLKVRRSAVNERVGTPSAASRRYMVDLAKEVDHV